MELWGRYTRRIKCVYRSIFPLEIEVPGHLKVGGLLKDFSNRLPCDILNDEKRCTSEIEFLHFPQSEVGTSSRSGVNCVENRMDKTCSSK